MGLYLGSYGGPREGGRLLISEVPLKSEIELGVCTTSHAFDWKGVERLLPS